MVQWLLHLPTQGTQFQSLVGELRFHIVVLQSPSRVWLFATLWTAARQVSLSLTNSRSLPKFMSTDLGATKSMCHSYWSLKALGPLLHERSLQTTTRESLCSETKTQRSQNKSKTKRNSGSAICQLSVSRSVVSDSLRPQGLYPARLLCLWDSPGKNTGVGCHLLLQGSFPIQGSNPGQRNFDKSLSSHFPICKLEMIMSVSLGSFSWLVFLEHLLCARHGGYDNKQNR